MADDNKQDEKSEQNEEKVPFTPVLNQNAGHQADLARYEQTEEFKRFKEGADEREKAAKAEAEAQEEVDIEQVPTVFSTDEGPQSTGAPATTATGSTTAAPETQPKGGEPSKAPTDKGSKK